MPRRPSAKDLIAESMSAEREAAAHRDLRATGWTLTTHGGHVFMAERAGVKLGAPSLTELHRQVSGR